MKDVVKKRGDEMPAQKPPGSSTCLPALSMGGGGVVIVIVTVPDIFVAVSCMRPMRVHADGDRRAFGEESELVSIALSCSFEHVLLRAYLYGFLVESMRSLRGKKCFSPNVLQVV